MGKYNPQRLVGILLLFTSLLGVAQASDLAELDVPQVFLRGIPYDITLSLEKSSDVFNVQIAD